MGYYSARVGTVRRLSMETRQGAYSDLTAPAMQLRVQLELIGQRALRDLDVRLAALEEHARLLGQHASRVAVLAPGEAAGAARELVTTATALVAFAARNAEMKYDSAGDGRFLIGEIRAEFDFTAFHAALDRMHAVIDADLASGHHPRRHSGHPDHLGRAPGSRAKTLVGRAARRLLSWRGRAVLPPVMDRGEARGDG